MSHWKSLSNSDWFLQRAAVWSTQAASILPTEVYCIQIRSCNFAFWLIVKALRHEMAPGLNSVNHARVYILLFTAYFAHMAAMKSLLITVSPFNLGCFAYAPILKRISSQQSIMQSEREREEKETCEDYPRDDNPVISRSSPSLQRAGRRLNLSQRAPKKVWHVVTVAIFIHQWKTVYRAEWNQAVDQWLHQSLIKSWI